MLTRRQALSLTVAGSALAGLAACGPNMPNRGSDADGNSLRFTWWGNAVRDKLTREAIDAYKDVEPDIDISAETGDWDGYWDKLATQTAGADTPDIVQMDEKYLMEYSAPGILLDLASSGLDTSNFEESVVATGEVPGEGLFAICAGINTPVLLANPDVFDAAGVDMPDDTTWTWDDLLDIAVKITENTDEGTYGVQQLLVQPMFQVYMRQLGKAQWTTEDVGFSAEDAAEFFEFGKALQDAGASPGASVAVEENGLSLEQTMFATGLQGMNQCWSNEVIAFDDALGGKAKLLRPPSLTGKAVDAGLWYKSGQYFSVSARSQNTEAAVDFVNWLVNSKNAGDILLAERGIPGSLEVREDIEESISESDTKAMNFIEEIEDEIGNPPAITPQGGGEFEDMLNRATEDTLFERTDSRTAGEALFTEASGAVQF